MNNMIGESMLTSANLRMCTRCIMDTTAPDIEFDKHGICNYCRQHMELLKQAHVGPEQREAALDQIIKIIKAKGRNNENDCILGVSGGLDSSYALYQAKRLGLKPLAVHLDNGWNSELAVNNIERLVKGFDVELYTHVIDWEEFKGLQRAFFKSNVIDIELLTDHAIWAILYQVALEHNIKYIIGGTNTATEGMEMPSRWNHYKKDLVNIKAINRIFGSGVQLRTFPVMGLIKYGKYLYFNKIKWISILDYVDYDKQTATQALQDEVGWRPYEKKHYESVFTRFYQGYILPRKFNVDKRKIHYSTLICSEQMSREKALALMEHDPYNDATLLESDREFVLQKLEFSDEEFNAYMKAPPVPHRSYPSNEWMRDLINKKVNP